MLVVMQSIFLVLNAKSLLMAQDSTFPDKNFQFISSDWKNRH